MAFLFVERVILMPGVGVGVIVFNESDELLLILRNDDPAEALSDMRLEGTWTLPAGTVKSGETILQAAKRKVKSETGLSVDNLEVISIADDINEYAHFVTIGLIARMCNGKIDLGDSQEHVEYRYFNLNELPDNLCEPSLKIINNYKENIIYRGE